MVSLLFRHIAERQGEAPYGHFLDAGTGVNSALWGTSLVTDSWTAVTAAPGHAAQVRDAVAARVRNQDRLIVGDWTDDALLAGESFDTVLADYLLGAIDGFAPYFQEKLFARLRPLTRRRLYVVGLDPYIVGEVRTEADRIVRRIGRLRDACLLLADENAYREYPLEWAADSLEASGFRIVSSRRFGNRYRPAWVNGQVDMCLRRLAHFEDDALAAGLRGALESARAEGLALCAKEDGLRSGADWVIEAAPV